MTAEELLNKNYEGSSIWGDLYKGRGDVYYENDTIKAMQEYAEIKCKKLLEIVAEKAETKELFVNGSNGGWYDKVSKVNRDSILNCVDIESFCK